MVQTYQGHFQDGRFISPQSPTIPEYVEVFVVVTNKSIPVVQSKTQKRKSDLILPPSLDTRGWKFDREDANAR